MDNDSINGGISIAWRHMEDKLTSLIEETNRVIKQAEEAVAKLRKIMNTMLVLLGIFAVPFLYSFVDMNSSINYLEKEGVTKEMLQESNDKMYEAFVTKIDALAVHMFERDWMKTELYQITKDEKYRETDDQVKQIIKAFFGSTNRSAGKEKKK